LSSTKDDTDLMLGAVVYKRDIRRIMQGRAVNFCLGNAAGYASRVFHPDSVGG